jgi:type VI secretion system secreted protein Hcp
MAFDYFLKIDGIEGESTVTNHEHEIDIESFSWGETNAASAAHGAGGGGAGKVSAQDFHFVMRFNKASPKLFLATATGEHLKQALLTARTSATTATAGKGQVEFLKWKLTDCLVTSYQTGANTVPVTESTGGQEEPSPEVTAARNASAGAPVDEFSLDFAQIEVSYTLQNPEGTPVGLPVTAVWDFRSNKKI